MDKEPTLQNYADIVITKSQVLTTTNLNFVLFIINFIALFCFSIQLSTATVIDKDGLAGDPNGFIVHVNDGHLPQWNLRADSAREKKNWLTRLNNLVTIIKWVRIFIFKVIVVLILSSTSCMYMMININVNIIVCIAI